MDTNKYKTLLEEKLQDVERIIPALKATSKPVDLDEPMGRLSRMDAIQQQQMQLANLKKAEIRIDQIKAALKRIEEGTYGYCVNCEETLSDERLQAMPEAPLCTNCQQ